MTSEKPVNCRLCRHFFVTWDQHHPQGCRLYGVKSRQAPSMIVRESTGAPCQFWEPRPPRPRAEP
jgi:hypothetical protein